MKYILLALFFLFGCSDQELSHLNEDEIFDQWWIVAESNSFLSKYENNICFNIYSYDQTLYFYIIDESWYDGPYYWEKTDANTYNVDGFAEVTIEPVIETKKEDWKIKAKQFLGSSTIIAESCPIKNL